MISGSDEPSKKIPGLDADEVEALYAGPSGNGSAKEAEDFNQGLSVAELERKARQNEHKRSESFKNHFENVAICTLWIVAALALAVGVTWFWHLLMPDRLHWLSSDGVQKLQNIVTGGIVASLAAGHIKKRLGT